MKPKPTHILLCLILGLALGACALKEIRLEPRPDLSESDPGPEIRIPEEPKPEPVSQPQKITKLEPILRLDTRGHTSLINDLIVTADGKYLISCSDDKTIRVWDTRTKKEVRKILGEIGEGPFGQIFAIALSPDDSYLAVGGFWGGQFPTPEDIRIRIYHFPTGRLIRNLKSHSNVVHDLAFSDDGAYLISGSGDNTVKVWDPGDDFRLIHTFREHQDSVYGVRIFRYEDDYRIVSAGYDDQVFLCSLKGEKVLASFSHGDKVNHLAISRKHIASAGYDHKINIFDLNLRHIRTIDSETKPVGLTFSRDGKLLLAGSRSSYSYELCNIYDTEQNFKKIGTFREHDNLTRAVAFLNNDTAVTGGGNDSDIYFWNPRTGQTKGHIPGHGKRVWAVGLSGDEVGFGNTYKYENHNNRGEWEKVFDLAEFKVSEIPSSEKAGTKERFRRISTQYKDYTLSHTKGGPYGRSDAVLVIKQGGEIIHRIVRSSTDGIRHRTYGFTPDGTILSGGANGHLKAYNLDGEETANFAGHTGEVWTIALDGHWLASAGNDQVIMLWDLRALQERKTDISPGLSLFVSKENEWVVWTPEGFFNASPGGAKYVGYHINRGKDNAAEYIEADQLYDLFYRPDLVAKRWQGGHEDHIRAELHRIGDISEVLKSGLPPVLRLLSQPVITQNKRDFTMSLEIEDRGGGVGRIIYRVNGVVVESPRGSRPVDVFGARRFNRPFTLNNGKNIITATAYNKKGKIESRPVEVTVEVDDPLTRMPDLYGLAVGITIYRDHALRLKYAALDAQAFARELETRGKALFRNSRIRTLLDRQATIPGIRKAFEELAPKIKPSDVFVFYLAGHGMTLDSNYHFIPWELRFENTDTVRKQSLSHDKIQELLAKIPALKSLVILDTCSSGTFATLASRGLAEKTAIDKLMRATGRATLAASSDTQQALEGHKGHGVFTHALLQGLREQADRLGDKDGSTEIDELADFVREEVPKITYKRWGYEQIPMRYMRGDPFPIGCREGFDGPGCKAK